MLHQHDASSCISSDNNIVELTAPVVARRVPEVPEVLFFLQRNPVVCYKLGEQPDANNEEVVPKEPGALQHILIEDANELVAEPALLLQRLVPARVAMRRTSAELDRTDQEEVNPELAAVFRKFHDKLGKQRPLTPPLVYNQSLRPCYLAWPMLF